MAATNVRLPAADANAAWLKTYYFLRFAVAAAWVAKLAAAVRAADLGIASIHVSLSHDAGIASAVVVCEG